MQMNLDKIIDVFENNASILSVEGKDLKDFFKNIPISDRSMIEAFMRTELGGDPINEMSEIFPQTFWNSSGIQKLTIPATIKACAAGVFKGSDLQEVTIATPFNGEINIDIFAGAENLTDVYFDPSIAKSVKNFKADLFDPKQRIVLHLPKEFVQRLEAGVMSAAGIGPDFDESIIFDAEGLDDTVENEVGAEDTVDIDTEE